MSVTAYADLSNTRRALYVAYAPRGTGRGGPAAADSIVRTSGLRPEAEVEMKIYAAGRG